MSPPRQRGCVRATLGAARRLVQPPRCRRQPQAMSIRPVRSVNFRSASRRLRPPPARQDASAASASTAARSPPAVCGSKRSAARASSAAATRLQRRAVLKIESRPDATFPPGQRPGQDRHRVERQGRPRPRSGADVPQMPGQPEARDIRHRPRHRSTGPPPPGPAAPTSRPSTPARPRPSPCPASRQRESRPFPRGFVRISASPA
jgi:hypothetical protein